MITTILLLWIASQLVAPTWVFALIWVRFGIFCITQIVEFMKEQQNKIT